MTRTLLRTVLVPCALATLTPIAGCSKGDNAPPVATVSFTSSKTRLPIGSPVELTYKFIVAPDAKIDGDYRVFVHVVDADMKTIWNDDHDPANCGCGVAVPPTSQWRPGQTITYTRTLFVPAATYLGEATVQIGLAKGDERLPLIGSDPADRQSTERAYKVGTLTLLPTAEAIFAWQKNGWHPTEFAPDNPSLEWNWTQKAAVLALRNPRKDVTFYLQFDGRPDIFDHPQQVTVYVGGQPISKFEVVSTGLALERIPITAAQLGTNEAVEVRVEVDRTFVPANLPAGGKDLRELGFRIYHYYFEPK